MSRPSAPSPAFEFQTLPQKITTGFDQNVSASLSASDMRVDRVCASDAGPVGTSLTYDSLTNTATHSFAGVLQDGNYRSVLLSQEVFNTSGELLTNDQILDFFFLSGDANHDRVVNLDDNNILASNYNQSGKTYSQGDFNYDGKVDLDDFNILGTKFNASIAAPPTAPDQLVVSPLSTSEINLQWVDHTDNELGMRVQRPVKWEVLSGADYVELKDPNGEAQGDVIELPLGRLSVTANTTGYSRDIDDVKIRLSVNGDAVAEHRLTVHAPTQPESAAPPLDEPVPGQQGYRTTCTAVLQICLARSR